jgi:hypothetical protein
VYVQGMVRTRSVRLVTFLLVVLLRSTAARADWVVNEHGECVRQWTTASLARGPAAMLNAPLLPFRSAVGGVLEARESPGSGLREKIMLPPILAFGGGAMGLVESLIWLGTGLADTLTGGYFGIAPDEATRLAIDPVRPAFLTAAGQGSTDHCGRRIGSGRS